MLPTIVKLGPITIHSFGFMLALAFLIIAWLAGREFERRGHTADDAWSVTFAAMVGGVLGAKLYFLFDHLPETLQDPKGMILSGAGLTYYGGLFGGALAVILTARRRGVRFVTMAQMGAPLIALGYGVGRLGCFLNGDDYGKPSDVPWAMAFPKGSPPTQVPVHPTQVYEAGASLAFFWFLWATRKRWDERGTQSLGVFLIFAGIERFLVEFVRLNPVVAMGLTVAQIISVALAVLGVYLLLRSRSS